jgi:hypothetical protein
MAEPQSDVDPLTQIRVEGGNASPDLAAAAIAVVAGMLREGGAVDEQPPADGWRNSILIPRKPIAGLDWVNSLRQ